MKKGEENERNIFIKDSAGNEGVAGAGFKKKRNDTYRTYNVDFERVQKANGSEIGEERRRGE